MTEKDLESLLRKRQEEFIVTRTQIENEVNTFLKSLETLDEDIKNKIGVDEGKTTRDWLPELWSSKFQIEVYREQLAHLTEYIEKVHSVCDEINKEALRCLTE